MNQAIISLVDLDRVPRIERDLEVIHQKKEKYQDSVEDFVEKYENLVVDIRGLDGWRNDVLEIAQQVKDHAKEIWRRKEQICPSSRLNQLEQNNIERSLEVQELTLKVQQLTLQQKQEVNNAKKQGKVEEDLVMAETEANSFLGECSVLGDIMMDENWAEVEDETVSNAMRAINKWQDQWNRVERAFRQYENMAVKHKFSEEKIEAIRTTYEDRKERFEVAREAIRKEDSDRGLYTMEPVRSDIMKYPYFSGSASEDYLIFQETIVKRFRENKIKKKEQVAKLRECLRGVALGRVPLGIKDIEEAFRRLNEAFGSPSKVMGHTLKALEDLGTMPSEKLPSGQYSYTRRIEWLLKLEVILAKIIELSKRSTKLAHEAFGSATYRKLWARFPTGILDKLVKVPGEDAVRLQGILEKITKMREHAQVMDDECGSAAIMNSKKPPDSSPKVTADIFFRKAKRFDECRVCVHLSSTNKNHPDLFEKHVSNYPTGCPKFIEATLDSRISLVSKIQLCRQCFNPNIIWTRDHDKDCLINKKKSIYTCTNRNCNDHMWICLMHRTANKESMEKFKDDLQKQGHNLAFTMAMPIAHQLSHYPLYPIVPGCKKDQKNREEKRWSYCSCA